MNSAKLFRTPAVIFLGVLVTYLWIGSSSAWDFRMTAERDHQARRLSPISNYSKRYEIAGRYQGGADPGAREVAALTERSRRGTSLNLRPQLRLGDGLRLEGSYNIPASQRKDGAGDSSYAKSPLFSQELFARSSGSMSQWSAGIPDWGAPATHGGPGRAPDHFAAVVQAPMGMVYVGEREYPIGAYGAVVTSAYNDAALLMIPAGPLRFAYTTRTDKQGLAGYWDEHAGAGADLHSLNAAGISYRIGNLGLGGLTIRRETRSDPGRSTRRAGMTAGYYAADQDAWINTLFLKLNSGAFFFGGELAWVRSYSPGRAGRPPYTIGVGQTAARSGLAVIGFELGPTRLSLQYAVIEGRLGVGLNPMGSYLPETTADMSDTTGLTGDLPYILGAGHRTIVARHVSNLLWALPGAYRVACRADHALAVNLNMWTGIVLAGGDSSIGSTSLGIAALPNGGMLSSQRREIEVSGKSRYKLQVPDDFHSWEFNAGLHWDLMNGMTMDMRYALYRPAGISELTDYEPVSEDRISHAGRFVNYLQWNMAFQF